MNITMLCCTYGRPYFLPEVVESYRRQIIPEGVKAELLIVNSCSEQEIVCNVPGVRVANIGECQSVAHKLNCGFAMSAGEWVANLDDDDISLSYRLITSWNYVQKHPEIHATRQQKAWLWNNGDITGVLESQNFGSSFIRRGTYYDIGGADDGIPCDISVWNKLMNLGVAAEIDNSMTAAHFICRWHGMGVHYSGLGKRSEAELLKLSREKTKADPRYKPGRYEIVPKWNHDYEKQAKRAIERECR